MEQAYIAGRRTGLMGRMSMTEDRGMIFVFPAPGTYPFWMRNTPSSLATGSPAKIPQAA